MVVDNSVFTAWCMPDEQTPAAMQFLGQARTQQIVVPLIWPYEIANALGRGKKKNRLTDQTYQAALDLIDALDIRVMDGWKKEGVPEALHLMMTYSLTSYDAGYLALALEMNLPLATFDAELVSAAKQAGVTLAI